jgi:predicted  nucleic acid-binding Zn-ribbon protein
VNAAAQILLKQLKHLEEQETAIKVKAGTLNTELMELGEEQAGVQQSIHELKSALQVLSKPGKEEVKNAPAKKRSKN